MSHGVGCGSRPGIYTDVRHHVDWIKYIMAEKGNSTEMITSQEKKKEEIHQLMNRLLECHVLSKKFD